jgi:1-acyl-sn-glycerol-3-phosphate acyltransferase
MLQLLFFALVVRPFMLLFIGLRIYGREHLRTKRPFIIVANHSSHLDAITLLSLFPLSEIRHIRPVAAEDYFGGEGLIGRISRTLLNVVTIPRRDIKVSNNPLPRLKEILEHGESLIIFPEGTRRSEEELGEFRRGVAHILEQNPGALVIPVYLWNLRRVLPKGEYIPVPVFCDARIGAPRILTGTKQEVTQALKKAIEELHG